MARATSPAGPIKANLLHLGYNMWMDKIGTVTYFRVK